MRVEPAVKKINGVPVQTAPAQNPHSLIVSRRNLLSLLAKLDGQPSDSACEIVFNEPGRLPFSLVAEEDDVHYAHPSRYGARPGSMHPETEQEIDRRRISGTQYTIIVADEPIRGMPSRRLYGLFATGNEAYRYMVDHNLVAHPYYSTGYSAIRPLHRLAEEKADERRADCVAGEDPRFRSPLRFIEATSHRDFSTPRGCPDGSCGCHGRCLHEA